MNIVIWALIIILIILVVLIISMSLYYKKVLKTYNNDMQVKVSETIQKMFEIMGKNIPVDSRFLSLNNILLTELELEYSTICIYNGNNYEVRATNIEKEYREAICDIVKDNTFKNNISKKSSKYLTVEKNRTLMYKSAIERNIKSALFLPLYYNNKFIGFWLIESKKKSAYDKIKDDQILKLKNDIAIFIDDAQFQDTLEFAKNKDNQTGFYNNIYLYSTARNMISLYENSAIVLVGMVGLPDINEGYNRNIGNILLVKMANNTKSLLPKDSVFVRYSGLRFVIIIPNATAQSVQSDIERLLSKYKETYEYVDDEKVTIDTQILIHTYKRQSNIEKEIQKINYYMDGMKAINTIKII